VVALFVRNAAFLLRDAQRIERAVDILIERNRISAVGSCLPVPPHAEVIDASGCAVMPGLINAHTHLYQNWLKGIGAGLTLVPWCDAAIFPMVDVLMREHHAGNLRPSYLWTALASIEMIRAGTTCCQNLDVAAPGILQAWAEVGLRGVGAITLADDWIPAAVMTDRDRLKQNVLDYLAQWHDPTGRLTIHLGPSAPFLCSDSLLQWTRETAEAHDLGIHIHMNEVAQEVQDSLRTYGKRPVERLAGLGLLSPRLSAVHCVHVNPAEIGLLARHEASVVHCPKSNMKLADGIMPWPAMKAAGIAVALGNDGSASNGLLDMWEEMRAAALLAAVGANDPAAIGAADVFRAATVGGARACRVDAGTLDPGRLADITVVDLNGAHLRPIHDILETLVFSARACDVRDVIIDGRVVMLQQKILTVNEASLVAEADAMGSELYTRAQQSTVKRG
jgi:5-methylthioadenosine/S-adenosylhomocysteine deaminase